MEFDGFDQFDNEYDRGGHDDSEDREVVEDNPSPEEVSEFWAWVGATTEGYYEAMTIPF